MKNKLFDPPATFADDQVDDTADGKTTLGDTREGRVYVFNDEIILAINVALATGRPILVRGASGSGKSSLARSAANFKKWRYYEKVITSRTQARDLLYEVDLLRRLHDAQLAQTQQTIFDDDYARYVVPGVLWWAFDKASAIWRGAAKEKRNAAFPQVKPPPNRHDDARAVVLLDEIDKADPDVPNNLLVPLGSLEFQVEETGWPVLADPKNAPLVFITSNNERQLPDAFLRRCIELDIKPADHARLKAIGSAHFPDQADRPDRKDTWVSDLTNMLAPPGAPVKDLPSPAEYLDVLRAADNLGVIEGTPEWNSIVAMTVRKPAGS